MQGDPGTVASDGAQMERVAAGDEVACRALVRQHLPGVFNLAFRMLGDHGLAEDVAQEAFIRLWKQSKHWQAKASVRTWLFRVTHNLAIDAIRRRGRHAERELPETLVAADRPGETVYGMEIGRQVGAAVQALPERQRTAITLVHFEGVAAGEAAAVMGVSVEALESLLARARRRLRETLAVLRDELDEAG